MKKTIFMLSAMAMLGFSSCSKKVSVQKSEDMVEIKEPFSGSEFRSDKEFFRAVGQAKSQDGGFAKTKSETEARARLAASIKSDIKRVVQKYASEYSVNQAQEFQDKTQDMILDVTNQSLQDVRTMDQKTFKSKDGSYIAYTAIEANKETVYNGIKHKISSDAKLRVDFQEAQFKKVFDEEMKKFSEEGK